MPNEFVVIVCDECKKQPMTNQVKVGHEWKGVCRDCYIEIQRDKETDNVVSSDRVLRTTNQK